MANQRIDMHRLQELVRLHRLKTGARKVAELLQMSPNTERKYRQALEAARLLDGEVDDLPPMEMLAQAVQQHQEEPKPARQERSSVEGWRARIEELMDKGLTARAIQERLREEDEAYSGSYWAVWRLCKQRKKARGVQAHEVAIPVATKAGEIAQVDFGYVGKLMCPETHVPRRAWVFAMVLGYSRHMYAEVVFDQKTTTWLGLHQRAFQEFGGVVETVVPDNLKAAVIKSAFGTEDSGLNRSYRELARYYGFKISPAPPYQPQKKGKVESVIKYLKGGPLAGRDNEDLQAVNAYLVHWVNHIAGPRKHGTTGQSPLVVFEQQEKPTLRALPSKPYEVLEWKQAKVHQDAHVMFARALYSVPWRWTGKTVWVQASTKSVMIFGDDTRIATHCRIGRGQRSTVESHLPVGRRDLRHRSRSYWEERAAKLGPQSEALAIEVFESDDVLCQLRKVQAIVTHLEGFPVARAEAAAQRARFYGTYNYQGIKAILSQALDFEPLPTAIAPVSEPDQPPRFARSAREMLAGFRESEIEPH